MSSLSENLEEFRGEARIDRAIALGLGSSQRLCARFAQFLGWPSPAGLARVTLNRTHGDGPEAGESDAIVEFPGVGVILCETKFDAQFQDRQGERYAQRVTALVKSGALRADSVLCAPAGYLTANANHPQAKAFGHRLSVEDWAKWLETNDDMSREEAIALRLFTQVSSDWNAHRFQGVKGKWVAAYTALSSRFANADDGWYVRGNPGDWIHIHHDTCRLAKFHYRNRDREVSLELRSRNAQLSAAAADDARQRGWRISGKKKTVVIRPVSVRGLAADDEPSERDVDTIVNGLEVLRRWWARWNEGVL